MNSVDSQTEHKKKSRRLYIVLFAVVLLVSAIFGVATFDFFNTRNVQYGPGTVYIDELTTDKPYYLQGEKANVTVTVNNPQDWPVIYPSYVGYTIEKDGFPLTEGCGVYIDYATPAPAFPSHSRTLYSPPAGLTLPARPGNYTLIVSFNGWSYNGSVKCTFEVRPNPAGFNYTESIMVGDWVKYDIGVSWIGSGAEPSSVAEFKQMEWEMDRVQIVGDFLVNTTTHFKNGTDQFWLWTGGLTASGISYSWLIFPPSLEKGDTFQLYACPPSLQNFRPDYVPSIVDIVINDTVTRSYMGSSRSVNVWSLTSSSGGVQSGTLYWDQKTGVLLEYVWRASLAGGTVQWSYKASETNMWHP